MHYGTSVKNPHHCIARGPEQMDAWEESSIALHPCAAAYSICTAQSEAGSVNGHCNSYVHTLMHARVENQVTSCLSCVCVTVALKHSRMRSLSTLAKGSLARTIRDRGTAARPGVCGVACLRPRTDLPWSMDGLPVHRIRSDGQMKAELPIPPQI